MRLVFYSSIWLTCLETLIIHQEPSMSSPVHSVLNINENTSSAMDPSMASAPELPSNGPIGVSQNNSATGDSLQDFYRLRVRRTDLVARWDDPLNEEEKQEFIRVSARMEAFEQANFPSRNRKQRVRQSTGSLQQGFHPARSNHGRRSLGQPQCDQLIDNLQLQRQSGSLRGPPGRKAIVSGQRNIRSSNGLKRKAGTIEVASSPVSTFLGKCLSFCEHKMGLEPRDIFQLKRHLRACNTDTDIYVGR